MKRFLCAVAAVAVLFILVACSRGVLATPATPTPNASTTPTSSTSRNVRNVPVSVTETYANTEVVSGTTQEASNTPATTDAAAAPAETPATGDFPVTYFAGILGLILVCSAGLLMLKRI